MSTRMRAKQTALRNGRAHHLAALQHQAVVSGAEFEAEDPSEPLLPLHPRYLRVKAAFDFMAAAVLLLLASPVLLSASLLIKLTSRGPVLYRQVRVGRHGKLFTLIKLRTMVVNAEAAGAVWSAPNDPRVTSVGRILRATHIDEMPQLIHVLCGQMSLIGPRPERPELVAKFDFQLPRYPDRHNIRPGLSGLAQLQLPPDSDLDSVRRKLLHDLYYVRHVSFWLDTRIFLATISYLAGSAIGVVTCLLALPDITNTGTPPEESRPEETLPA